MLKRGFANLFWQGKALLPKKFAPYFMFIEIQMASGFTSAGGWGGTCDFVSERVKSE